MRINTESTVTLKNRFRRFVYRTRGLYLLAALLVILWLKHRVGSTVSLGWYASLLAMAVAAQSFRTWAAGFVGTTARAAHTSAEVLLTAGPYAHVRNPMYLGNFVIVLSLALMSGLWYAPLIACGAWVFVYAKVIPYEEDFLRHRFADEYEAYTRAVPRLLPSLQRFCPRHGVFRLREGLANEAVAWPVLIIMASAFRFL